MANYNLANTDPSALYTSSHSVRGNGIQTLTQLVELKGKTLNDTFTLWKLPVGVAPVSVVLTILEDAGETCTFSVGFQSGAAGATVGATLASAANLNQAAGTVIAGAGTDMIEGSGIQAAIGGNAQSTVTYIGGLVASGTTLAAGKVFVTLTVVFP